MITRINEAQNAFPYIKMLFFTAAGIQFPWRRVVARVVFEMDIVFKVQTYRLILGDSGKKKYKKNWLVSDHWIFTKLAPNWHTDGPVNQSKHFRQLTLDDKCLCKQILNISLDLFNDLSLRLLLLVASVSLSDIATYMSGLKASMTFM